MTPPDSASNSTSTNSAGRPIGVGGGGGGSGPGSSRISKKVERSCIVCHRRKVRCDKRSPCATCTRTGVLCCYPSGDRAAPRHPKATIADIATRLVQLERTLVAVSSDLVARDGSERPEPSLKGGGDTPDDDDDDDDGDGDGALLPDAKNEMLVHSGYSTRYINEILLSRVLEEEQEIQSVLARPRSSEHKAAAASASPSSLPSFGLLSAISYQSHLNLPTPEAEDLHPSMPQALQLWQAYVQNVEPLNKVLHIPTAQVAVYTAINNPNRASAEVNCLLFAVYCAATTSLTPAEARHMLGREKSLGLNRFRHGLDRSLAQASFLENPTLTILQALAIFLRTVRAFNTGRSVWILWGLAIRAAQSIGLHRDGSKFDLPPFEAEIRRRLWWHMMAHDHRSAEDHGITVDAVGLSFDTHVPLNVNDSALDPAMTELPPPLPGWSEMTLPILMVETSQASLRLFRLPPADSRREGIVARHTERCELLLQQCNPVVPIQRATLLMMRIVLRKLAFINRLQWLSASHKSGLTAAHATEENLEAALEILELNASTLTDELLHNFRWSCETYTQYRIILYVLWHLCVKPAGGANVERAWAAVDGAFVLEKARQDRQDVLGSNDPSGSTWTALRMLKDKAVRAREAHFAADSTSTTTNNSDGNQTSAAATTAASSVDPTPTPGPAPSAFPSSITTEMAPKGPEEAAVAAAAAAAAVAGIEADLANGNQLPDSTFFDGMMWESNSFPDWDMFMSDFRATARGFDFPGN